MRNDIVARALRGRLISKVTKSVLSAYGIDKIVTDLDRRVDIDPKRALVWSLYYYTNLPLKIIGERVGCGYCNTMYLVKTMNGLISTDHRVANVTIELETILKQKKLKKRNRFHKHKTIGNALDYATSYKKETKRPISENKKAMSILLATNDDKIIKSILKGKREQIEKEQSLDKVIELSKEIKSLEYQLSVL